MWKKPEASRFGIDASSGSKHHQPDDPLWRTHPETGHVCIYGGNHLQISDKKITDDLNQIIIGNKSKSDYLNKCKVCGKYKNNQIKCEICKLELCKNCFELHLRKFFTHFRNYHLIFPSFGAFFRRVRARNRSSGFN